MWYKILAVCLLVIPFVKQIATFVLSVSTLLLKISLVLSVLCVVVGLLSVVAFKVYSFFKLPKLSDLESVEGIEKTREKVIKVPNKRVVVLRL